MSVECCECHKTMGHKEGEGVSHGICRPCMAKNHPEVYRMIRDREALALARTKRATMFDAPTTLAEIASMDRVDKVILRIAA